MELSLVLSTALGVLLSAVFAVSGVKAKEKIIACYFTNWSQYRDGVGRFMPADIDPSLCTYVFYAFAKINVTENTIMPIEWNYDKILHPGILALKRSKPSLKLILSVGGYNALPSSWVMASQSNSVADFSRNVVNYIRRNQFDGVDIDWETPDSATANNYLRLIKGLRAAIDSETLARGQERLLLITDVKANRNELPFYTPLQLAKFMDYIVLMAYDFYGSWSEKLGHHSPLFLSKAEPKGSFFSQNQGIQMWLNAGIPADKLILGIAAYGRSLMMSKASLHRPGDNFTGEAAAPAPYTKEKGFYAYYEVCKQRKAAGWKDGFMEESRVPYSDGPEGNELVWIGYDDPTSVAEKTVYAISRGLAGVMMWSLDFDDFTGTQCGSGTTYPLLRSINEVIGRTPRCKTKADCKLRGVQGRCVEGFCACPEGSYISTKKFCTEETPTPVLPNAFPSGFIPEDYGSRATPALVTSLWLTVTSFVCFSASYSM